MIFRHNAHYTITTISLVAVVFTKYIKYNDTILNLFFKVTPESIPQRNASFWKNDIMLNKEYEKSFQENQEGAPQLETLDLSDTFIASLFEEASKDKEVIERKEWIHQTYPRVSIDESW